MVILVGFEVFAVNIGKHLTICQPALCKKAVQLILQALNIIEGYGIAGTLCKVNGLFQMVVTHHIVVDVLFVPRRVPDRLVERGEYVEVNHLGIK